MNSVKRAANIQNSRLPSGTEREGMTKTTSPSASGKPSVNTSEKEVSDLPRHKVDHSGDLPPDKGIGAIVTGNLG